MDNFVEFIIDLCGFLLYLAFSCYTVMLLHHLVNNEYWTALFYVPFVLWTYRIMQK